MVLFDKHKLRSGRILRVLASDPLLAALRFGWIALILWGELGVFYYTLLVCRWPKLRSRPKMLGTGPTHILLIADAQIPSPKASSRTLSELFHDIYMHRAWHITQYLRPHVVFFLGDMLKNGRFIESDDEFAVYVQHFQQFFPLKPGVEARYIPGNTDVGLGVSNSFSKHVRQRYEYYFDPVNQHFTMANHSLILLDSPGIVDEDYIRAGQGTSFEEWVPLRDGAIEFVKGLAVEEQVRPAILFSHIPLHRAESKRCGPLRERGTIHRGVGHGWQKTLGKHTSSFLLESLRPAIIFSADDRDYCDISHVVPGSGEEIHEITVKSFSPARHITQPGFHLLSLYPGQVTSHAHVPCLLPRASGTFVRLYIPAAFLTMIILIFAHVRRAKNASRLRLTMASPHPSHAELIKLSPVPSPYSASSAYSYSYAYSNTPPPNSQRGYGDRTRSQPPPRLDSLHPLHGTAAPHSPISPPLPASPPFSSALEDEEHDGVQAHYLYMPPASPFASDLLARRHSVRTASPVEAITGPPARAWSFTYTFTFRGRRRHIAIHAPAWWPRRSRRRRKENEIWNAVGRDLGRVAAPALVTWVALVWWYSR